MRLVFLWFGTWKNGSGHYIPLWAKSRPEMFTHITGNRGRSVDSPSPLAEACIKADKKAFSALMRHLKSVGFGAGPGPTAPPSSTATNTAVGGTRGPRGAGPDAGEAAPPPSTGRALVAQISENQFFITGSSCTIEFKPASGAHRDWLRVEEAGPLARKPISSLGGREYSPASAFRVARILNGDEMDHALPFGTTPQTLRVTPGTY